MFVALLFLIIVCVGLISHGYMVNNPENKAIIFNRRAIYFYWGIIYVALMLCCNFLATVGMPFNIQTDSVDFFQTINSGYIGHFIQVSIVTAIVVGAYLYARRYFKIPQYLLVAVIGIFAIAMYFPGIPYADTNDLYNYFLTNQYSDWQPPLYTLSWHIFRFYGAAFLVNMLSYYGGLTLISYVLYKNGKNWQNDLLVLFSFNPILFGQLNIVLKETLFAGLLIDCVAVYLLLTMLSNKLIRGVLYFLYLSFIFVVIGIRYNAIIAVLPLVWLIVGTLLGKYSGVKKLATQATFTLLIVVTFAKGNIFVAYNIFTAKKVYSPTIVMFNDMVNIECRSDHQFEIPDKLFVDQNKVEELRSTMCSPQIMNEYNYDPIFIANWNNIGNSSILNYDQTEETYSIAKKVWISAIISHPWDYLVYRTRFFANDILGQYYMPAFAPISFGSWPKDVAQPASDGVQIKSQQFITEISQTQRYDMRYILSIFTIAATIIMFGHFIIRRNYSIAWFICLSNLLTLISLYIAEGEHPARYFLWSNIATLLVIVLADFSSNKETTQG